MIEIVVQNVTACFSSPPCYCTLVASTGFDARQTAKCIFTLAVKVNGARNSLWLVMYWPCNSRCKECSLLMRGSEARVSEDCHVRSVALKSNDTFFFCSWCATKNTTFRARWIVEGYGATSWKSTKARNERTNNREGFLGASTGIVVSCCS